MFARNTSITYLTFYLRVHTFTSSWVCLLAWNGDTIDNDLDTRAITSNDRLFVTSVPSQDLFP